MAYILYIIGVKNYLDIKIAVHTVKFTYFKDIVEKICIFSGIIPKMKSIGL